MKKLCIYGFLLLLIITGCARLPESYQYAGQPDEIVCIELLYNQNEYGEGVDMQYISLIRTLEEDELIPFMNEIYKLETKRISPPFWGYGAYIAKVSYVNGDVEMLGSVNIEYIPKGKEPTGEGRYIYVGDEFISVFANYVDLSMYPAPY